jgi:hypothetical protein
MALLNEIFGLSQLNDMKKLVKRLNKNVGRMDAGNN